MKMINFTVIKEYIFLLKSGIQIHVAKESKLMAKFITGKDLEKVIYDIIWEAENTLLIVSPFIKLDDYFQDLV